MPHIRNKAKLLSFAPLLLILIPMWAFVVYEIRHEREMLENSARQNAMNLATAFEAHVRSVTQHMDTILLDMRDDALEGLTHFDRIVQEELPVYGDLIAQLAIIDAEGKLIYSNLRLLSTTVDLSDRDHYRAHLENPTADRLFISQPVLGRVSGIWTLQFTRPLIRDGVFAGVLVVSVPTARFSDYYHQINVGPNGSIMLLGLDRGLRAIAATCRRNRRASSCKSMPTALISTPACRTAAFTKEAPLQTTRSAWSPTGAWMITG